MLKSAIGICVVACATTLYAGNIISVSDATPGSTGSFNVATNRALAVSFTVAAGQTFNNVAISAAVGFPSSVGGSSRISAFVTTQLGPGTTAGAHEVGATGPILTPVTVPNLPQGLFLLPFGALSLSGGAGGTTYFLSLFATPDQTATGISAWDGDVPTVTSDVGATAGANFFAATTFDGAYAPASEFTLQTFGPGFFSVTGDPEGSVPEPTTFALLSVGVLAAFMRRRLPSLLHAHQPHRVPTSSQTAV